MKKIAIIEDEASLSKALTGALESAGFKVCQAYDGEEGLILIQSEKPDLILLDIVMPKMDGLTMLNKLRKDDWGKDMPVIILSNLRESSNIAAAVIALTCKDLLMKDILDHSQLARMEQEVGLQLIRATI